MSDPLIKKLEATKSEAPSSSIVPGPIIEEWINRVLQPDDDDLSEKMLAGVAKKD